MGSIFDHTALKATFVNAPIIDVLFACLLSFVLGSIIAISYVRTFNGLSYSKGYIQALIFGPIITAIAMQAIGDSVARGLGLMGAFTLLRFRTNIKDTRDMMFIFAALTAGLVSGVYAYGFAIVSISFFCLVVFVLNKVPFSTESNFDAVLKMQVNTDSKLQQAIDIILKENSRRFLLISAREMGQGNRLELAYQVKVRSNESQFAILRDLGKIESLSGLNMFMQDISNEA